MKKEEDEFSILTNDGVWGVGGSRRQAIATKRKDFGGSNYKIGARFVGKLSVHVNKTPHRISLKSKDGKTILELEGIIFLVAVCGNGYKSIDPDHHKNEH